MRISVYTSYIVIGLGIVYCTRNAVVRGRLVTSCCRRGRLPPYGGGLLRWQGGVNQLGVLDLLLDCLGDHQIHVASIFHKIFQWEGALPVQDPPSLGLQPHYIVSHSFHSLNLVSPVIHIYCFFIVNIKTPS